MVVGQQQHAAGQQVASHGDVARLVRQIPRDGRNAARARPAEDGTDQDKAGIDARLRAQRVHKRLASAQRQPLFQDMLQHRRAQGRDGMEALAGKVKAHLLVRIQKAHERLFLGVVLGAHGVKAVDARRVGEIVGQLHVPVVVHQVGSQQRAAGKLAGRGELLAQQAVARQRLYRQHAVAVGCVHVQGQDMIGVFRPAHRAAGRKLHKGLGAFCAGAPDEYQEMIGHASLLSARAAPGIDPKAQPAAQAGKDGKYVINPIRA